MISDFHRLVRRVEVSAPWMGFFVRGNGNVLKLNYDADSQC